MKYKLLQLLFLSLAFRSMATEITYELRMPRPQNHYFQVAMKVSGLKQKRRFLNCPFGPRDRTWSESFPKT